MFDPVTLDQLRAFVAVVEEGNFSAAARKLKRVQSAVSTSMANLEDQLGVRIWDRTTKIATLTDGGRAVLAATRRVLAEVDGLKQLTAGLVRGLEASVSLCVDVLFPVSALVDLCAGFARQFPAVDLRVDTQLMSAVADRVLHGKATIGVATPLGTRPGLERKGLAPIRMIAVVAPDHSLARSSGPVAARSLLESVQIVLSEGVAVGVADQAVLSPRTWRVGDLHTKHAMLRAGLGWGNLPEHVVRDDLRSGALVAIRPAGWGRAEHTLPLSAIYRSDTTFGPAHAWLLAELEVLCARDAGVPGSRAGRSRARATARRRARER